jgi:hypothetical protein
MAKIKIEFGFGTGLDRSGANIPYDRIDKGIETVNNTALRLFGGYTRYCTQGGWKDEFDGKVFIEHGATIVVFVDLLKVEDDRVANLVAVIKSALNQRAVYVTKTLVECDLM